MRVAVVIPVYNHARYVAKAIESVLGQTRLASRIIAIDDGSTDDSLAVCERFEPHGVEVISQENRGAHATISRGVAFAAENCDVIAILNSDDHYAPERLEKCVGVFENDTAAAVVASKLRYIDDADQPLPDDHPRAKWLRAVWSRWNGPDVDFAEWMGQANFVVTTSNVVARREFLLAHPFKPYRFNHDYYFLAQAAIRGVLCVIGEPLVNYRVHPANTINTSPAPLMREMLLQHLELYRDLAPELAGDIAMRGRFFRYLRGSWDNVSAFHAGVMQVLLAGRLASEPAGNIESLVRDLDESAWPELTTYPNKQLVSTFAGEDPFAGGSGALAEKFAAARAERDELRAQLAALRELTRLRQRLLASWWAALGRSLGVAGEIETDAGRTPQEKLANVREAVRRSRWLRMGGISAE
jgi:glycosyltransferase involved in cell wall biosynthesis